MLGPDDASASAQTASAQTARHPRRLSSLSRPVNCVWTIRAGHDSSAASRCRLSCSSSGSGCNSSQHGASGASGGARLPNDCNAGSDGGSIRWRYGRTTTAAQVRCRSFQESHPTHLDWALLQISPSTAGETVPKNRAARKMASQNVWGASHAIRQMLQDRLRLVSWRAHGNSGSLSDTKVAGASRGGPMHGWTGGPGGVRSGWTSCTLCCTAGPAPAWREPPWGSPPAPATPQPWSSTLSRCASASLPPAPLVPTCPSRLTSAEAKCDDVRWW